MARAQLSSRAGCPPTAFLPLVRALLGRSASCSRRWCPTTAPGSIWSQCLQKGKEHVAPTVRAVISQVNRVADCVIATCLGDRSVKAADRARVVEHWIEVARECRTLHNFSSALAILSALESHVMGRQEKTWAEVSRASFRLFQTLSGKVSTEINASLGSELISQVKSRRGAGAQEGGL
nr:ral guanine nucleotide dissociation stimulator-like [Dasypus novemcinctus]